MNRFVFFCLAFSFVAATEVFAASCPDIVETEGSVQATQMKLGNGLCYVRFVEKLFSPNKARIFPVRTMSWDTAGHFMSVIDSGSRDGARGYHIVPASENLTLSGTLQQGSAYRAHASGLDWSIDKKTARLQLPPNCKGQILPASMSNQGGVNISSCAGKLVIDSGWRLGGSPELNRNAQSKIHDPDGATCSVTNSAIFKYIAGEEASPRFKSGQEWYQFLKSQPACSSLSLDFLKSGSAPTSPTSAKKARAAQ